MKMIMTCAKGNKYIVGVEYVHSDEEKIVLILENMKQICNHQMIGRQLFSSQ
ncbi:unnamed protein product [Paramecium sonneborni]|uniref:Uncharacterized protein n=1 Tax=Paramecium sonneborni TaxID=65129 RepID=A0A8S1PV52_9CILI|nr:unnamed protein product [Paramecium sonneborni]